MLPIGSSYCDAVMFSFRDTTLILQNLSISIVIAHRIVGGEHNYVRAP